MSMHPVSPVESRPHRPWRAQAARAALSTLCTLFFPLVFATTIAAPSFAEGEPVPEKPRLTKEARQWDTNHDGELDAAERSVIQATLLERWDADGDGKLSGPERDNARAAGDLPKQTKARVRAEAARRRVAAQRIQQKVEKQKIAGEAKQRFDTNRDGVVTKEEVVLELERPAAERAAAQRKQNLERYDRNGDGRLDEEERRTARRENGLLRLDEIDAVLERAEAEKGS